MTGFIEGGGKWDKPIIWEDPLLSVTYLNQSSLDNS